MSFHDKGYKAPSTSNYMKLLDGQNKFRVLSDAITGFEYWNINNKPVRSKTEPTSTPSDIRYEKDKDGNDVPTKIKHFWAFVVWNYADERVQILEITQKSIQEAILSYLENDEWGEPKEYDITVTRKGSGFDTEYQVAPSPHKKLPKEIQLAYETKPIRLEALYDGADPFSDIKVANKPAYPEAPKEEIPF